MNMNFWTYACAWCVCARVVCVCVCVGGISVSTFPVSKHKTHTFVERGLTGQPHIVLIKYSWCCKLAENPALTSSSFATVATPSLFAYPTTSACAYDRKTLHTRLTKIGETHVSCFEICVSSLAAVSRSLGRRSQHRSRSRSRTDRNHRCHRHRPL